MLAKALARESGANFLSIATSTIFNKYVGDSEQNTRAIFTLAARLSPCVIFIDEIDSLLSSRQSSDSSEEYTRKVKNEFMASWDGLMTDENLRVVVIGCTNRPFDLDDAVLRRFLPGKEQPWHPLPPEEEGERMELLRPLTGRTACVTHGGYLRMLTAAVYDIPLTRFWDQHVLNVSSHYLTCDGQTFALGGFNLSPEEVIAHATTPNEYDTRDIWGTRSKEHA